MKKIISILLLIILIVITTTAFAVYVDSPLETRLKERGCTEEDIKEIIAIIACSDENVHDFIIQKYKSLGDWKKVREAYNIDEDKYNNYINGMDRWQAILDSVPKTVMSDMKAEGLSQREINYFVSKINLVDVDFEYAWDQYKSGKTVDDIVKEKIKERKRQSELDTKYIMDEITTEEYVKSVAEITKGDETTISQILFETQKLRTQVRNRHRLESGITDEEIAYCEAQGMLNPMDMFQAKYIAKGNNVSFEKVVASKLKNSNWISATAELLNIPLEEYKKQVEQSIAN